MSTCDSCGAEIVWAVTASGKRMPLDAQPVTGLFTLGTKVHHGTTVKAALSVGPAYRSHFATCPNADEHRKAA